jgi:hypothetical protein
MASSQYEHADPDVKAIIVRLNHAYATLLTMLSLPGMMGIANDVNAIVFKDKDGNAYKTLQDASGASTLAENSVVIIDSSGRATSNASFKFDSANARITFPLPFTLAFGDQDTNGSIRIRITTDGIYFGKRVAGAWEEVDFLA